MKWTKEWHEAARARCKEAQNNNGLYMYLLAAFAIADLPAALDEIERLWEIEEAATRLAVEGRAVLAWFDGTLRVSDEGRQRMVEMLRDALRPLEGNES